MRACIVSTVSPPVRSGVGARLSMAVNAQADARGVASPDIETKLRTHDAVGFDVMPDTSTDHCRPISTRRPDAPGRDWFDSDECAAILTQRFEPETSNPFAHDREPDPEIDA